MMVDYDKLFAANDIYYPSKVSGFISWGIQGTIMLNHVREIFMRRMREIGYGEIILPVTSPKEDIDRYLNDKKSKTVEALFDFGPDLVLAPFSDLLYVDYVTQNFLEQGKTSFPQKAYSWSMCFIKEDNPNYANQRAYYQCESFSLQANKEEARRTWQSVSDCYKSICENELDLSPIYGFRPRVSVFPYSENTFVAEICKKNTTFFTLWVSHIMKTSFMVNNGFEKYQDLTLVSSCFSQKLLTWMLVHHSDQDGFRYPPALAPVIGIIIVPDNAELGRLYAVIRPPDSILLLSQITDVRSKLLEIGALWALQQVEDELGGRNWWLWKRGALEAKRIRFDDFYMAFIHANNYVSEFKAQLKRESAEKIDKSLYHAYSTVELAQIIKDIESTPGDERNNICAPCCSDPACQNNLVEKVKWTPKLQYKGDCERNCIICHQKTQEVLMFERTEVYPGFYTTETE